MGSGANKAKPKPPSAKKRAEKKARVTAEIERLSCILSEVDEKERDIAEGVIIEAANMRVTLEDLRADLDKEGWTELFQQSEKVAPYEKKRAKAEIYLNLNPNYQKIMDKLLALLPPPREKEEPPDEFDEFTDRKP